MPLLLGLGLVALFIWLAENVGTFAKAWHYPNQKLAWELVPITKFGAWFLLMIVSYTLVAAVHGVTTYRRTQQQATDNKSAKGLSPSSPASRPGTP
jgi:uncharacterized membrane protein YoaT (DUF817 family)